MDRTRDSRGRCRDGSNSVWRAGAVAKVGRCLEIRLEIAPAARHRERSAQTVHWVCAVLEE